MVKKEGLWMKEKIMQILRRNKKSPLSFKELKKKLGGKRVSQAQLLKILNSLISSGEVVCYQGRYCLTEYTSFEKAVISRVNGTFGFAKLLEKEGEVFLPGTYLLGHAGGYGPCQTGTNAALL